MSKHPDCPNPECEDGYAPIPAKSWAGDLQARPKFPCPNCRELRREDEIQQKGTPLKSSCPEESGEPRGKFPRADDPSLPGYPHEV